MNDDDVALTDLAGRSLRPQDEPVRGQFTDRVDAEAGPGAEVLAAQRDSSRIRTPRIKVLSS
jgi:hypothetical protein